MRTVTTITALIIVLYLSAFVQLLVKSASDVTLMQVTTTGSLGLGIGDTAPAATLDVGGDVHIALSDDGGNQYNLSVTEESWADNGTDLNQAINDGAFLTATINDTKPGHNAGIVKLNSNGLYVGLQYLGTYGVPFFVRIKVMGYLQ
jgi:hypothetical protein